ncbi:MAG: gluconate 2-dehydrogenase subunit 3 family protein [Candidatus Omnitrophica bacterium]|nr:gluconate 2-dehydrogenase subunit 3 family protein [Candidatus Omnitrophota bacterium]MCM8823343.1 gluconate 2-dehydrogenase subunit 3 family protein [Candidatus Omnitrophota bacterium]MCM8826556.1 gluconate 2-dehydrogenase subunit 3 family protein [Candidatus Omnitrophota bacterium]
MFSRRVTRRRFLKIIFLAWGSLWFISKGKLIAQLKDNSYSLQDRGDNSKENLKFFDDGQIKLLEAICSQIVPTDEYPGAKEVDVANKIDKLVLNSEKLQQEYLLGLRLVDELSLVLFNKRFVELEFDEQFKICEDMYNLDKDNPLYVFFNLVRSHTFKIFYESDIVSRIFNVPKFGEIISDYYDQ